MNWSAAATGGAPYIPNRTAYARSVTTARVQVGGTAFAAAWAEGRAMALEQAIVYALTDVADHDLVQ